MDRLRVAARKRRPHLAIGCVVAGLALAPAGAPPVLVACAPVVVFAAWAFMARESVVAASLVPAILMGGGIGAFVKTYRVWKEEGAWPAWQGAGLFLLTLMLVTLAIPGAAIYANSS